ncbi:MAG: hypothetical protein IJU27_06265 [Bacteroidales bacterium]|nr:hypothetical protein [Bacteroidales bacterium]
MKRFLLFVSLLSAAFFNAPAQEEGSSLLFYLSGENQVKADYAAGAATPNFASNVSIIEDGYAGKGIRCALGQRFAYKAPGNIYAQRGTLSFYWRGHEPFGKTEFPIFRVGFADHSSWDMVWLRIDWNGHGLDAFVTDNNLVRVRVSTELARKPDPDEWSHIAFSWDETTGIKLYYNGEMIARKDTSVVLNTGLDQFGPHSRIISPYQVQSAYNMQRGGDIDELRIYSQALTDAQIASLAANAVPEVKTAKRSMADAATAREWNHFYGFDTATPPYLEDQATTVRKVSLNESYDLARWWWKGNDGIRETTWPGVYNRSRIEGRNDYFQLPDWDCYSTSGIQVRFNMPQEPWNYVEISGGAFGRLGVTPNSDGSADREFDRKGHGTQHTFHKLAEPVTGNTLVFTNEVQETPIQEIDAYYVHEGDAPAGVTRLSYTVAPFQDYGFPQLVQTREFIEGRYDPQEREMLIGTGSAQRNSFRARSESEASMIENLARQQAANRIVPTPDALPIVHVVIPSDLRDININQEVTLAPAGTDDRAMGRMMGSITWRNIQGGLDGVRIELPAMNLKPGKDGLIPMNIQVKDPIWKMRNMADFSFSVKPGERRVIWLDLRDRILPDDEPLYLTVVSGAADFNAAALNGMNITLVFKDREEAKKEHTEDRFNQVRDAYAMLCEESASSRRYNKFVQVEKDLNDLIKVDPDNILYRRYWNIYYGGQSPLAYTEPVAPKNVPEWAFIQLEALKKWREIIEWYIDVRQVDYGEFGGGISDDTDLTNHFTGLYYVGDIREKIGASLHLFMHAIDREGTLTNGLSTIMTDGLHTYEEGENSLCQINYSEAGNPRQAERLMESSKSLREHVTGINDAGHLHFRSDYFSATKIAEEWPWTWSSTREYLHTGPSLMLGEFYGNPAAREYMIKFADSILAHKRYDQNGRMQVPAEINFTTDEVRSWGFSYLGALFHYVYMWTGKEEYREAAEYTGWWPREVSAEASVMQGRQVLRSYFARDYITTEGSIWIDRLAFDVDYVQNMRLGGIGMNRSSNMVPGNLVRWEFPGGRDAETVAINVTDRSRTGFKLTFFNTGSKAMKVDMIGVEVLGGDWQLSDGRKTSTVRFGRDRRVSFNVPAGKEYTVEMHLQGEGFDFNALPDLGIGSEDIAVAGNSVKVTVHNISGVDTPESVAALVNAKGKVVASVKVPALKAPVDLLPKTAQVTLTAPAGVSLSGLRVVIDPEDAMEEIYESNNSIKL